MRVRGLLIVAVTVAAAALASAAWAAPCGPAVALQGDQELVPPLAARLLGRGIAERAAPGCPEVRARVARRESRLLVVISDGGRRSERLVSSIEAAAVVIESWTRVDISDPLLRTRTIIVPASPLPLASPPVAAPLPLMPPRPRQERVHLALRGEAAAGTEGALWAGASLSACGRAGPLCIGGLIRTATAVPDAIVDGISFRQIGLDVLLLAAMPLRVGRGLLVPGVGLGGGFVRANGTGSAEGGVTEGGFRAELSLSAALPLGAGLLLDLALALGAGYPAGGAAIVEVEVRVRDSSGHGSGKEEYSIHAPAGPWGVLRGGLGLRWRGS